MDPRWLNNLPQQNQDLPIVNHIPQYQYQTQNPNNIPSYSKANDLLHKRLGEFWETQKSECEQPNEFRNHSLPLARIKKIMKSDEEVRMISADAPVLLSKACDMFIQDLTLRSWVSTEESKRRTLQKSDISAALSTTDMFDFLVDIVHREKPIVLRPPLPPIAMPVMAMAQKNDHQQHEKHDQHMGLSMQIVGNDQVTEMYDTSSNKKFMQGSSSSCSCLPQHSFWPPSPPDL